MSPCNVASESQLCGWQKLKAKPLEVREWNAEKGFGFIIPLVREDEEAPKSIFVHLWRLGFRGVDRIDSD